MNFVNLLGSLPTVSALDAFARTFFDAVGVRGFEQRESSNFPEGRYFKGIKGDLHFKISLSDEAGHDDLPYWVQVSSGIEADKLLMTVNSLVVEGALPRGFRLSRMIDFGKRSERRLDY
ncbi:MAG: hypothetical protein ABSF22_10015 [Bryobacteraceae bacterium]|jgi:hypothetical protein